jgi:serine/threonine protein phosphatase PrpC
MGDTLAKPICEKHTTSFETDEMLIAGTGMQGWRKNMEDAHILAYQVEGNRKHAMLGVFDGHNGQAIAKHAALNLMTTLTETEAFGKKEYGQSLTDAFLQLDAAMHTSELRDEGGCTAVAVLLMDSVLYCANAGDSRAVISRSGVAEPLSFDHKPTCEDEIARVEAAGGTINHGRVNGILSLTRALGDFDFKGNAARSQAEQVITALPDVRSALMTPDVDFIVVCCDGVFDVLSNDELCASITEKLSATDGDVALVCEMVLDECIADVPHGLGTDNMTITILKPKPHLFAAAAMS